MAIDSKPTITIPAPKFELYSLVSVRDSDDRLTLILGRFYDLDNQEWRYSLGNKMDAVVEGYLTPQTIEFDR